MSAMRKQFNLLKQFADQTFQKTERSEVLNEQLVSTEKRVELVRQCCTEAAKCIGRCLQGIGTTDYPGAEKLPRRLPEVLLTQNMLDSSLALGESSLLGTVLQRCSVIQGFLAREQLAYETDTEQHVLNPLLATLENECPNITKLRKQLGKLTSEMDQTKAKYDTATNHLYQENTALPSITTMGKLDILRANYEDSKSKVEQCRDSLAAEMFGLLSKETDLSAHFVSWYKLQASYHHTVAAMLDEMLPPLEVLVDDSPQKPMFGLNLAEHLASTGREIAFVIEACIFYLLEYGMDEEGLFRVAGSTSKMKKLKGALDAGFLDMVEEVRDSHTVGGLLKFYLRSFPEPLMTFELYDQWLSATQISDHDQKLRALWDVTNSLPIQNLNNLRYLVKFLSKLSENSAINKMTPQNISIVMAPNLIWPSRESFDEISSDSFGENIAKAAMHTTVVETLITYSDYFFPEEIEFTENSVLIPKSPVLSLNRLNNMSRSCSSDNSSSCGDVTTSPEDCTLTRSRYDTTRIRIRKKIKKQAPPIPTTQSIPEDTSPNPDNRLRRHSSSDKESSTPKKPPRRQSIDSTDSSRHNSSGESCGPDSPNLNSNNKKSSYTSLASPDVVHTEPSQTPNTPDLCLNSPELASKPPIPVKPAALNGGSIEKYCRGMLDPPLPFERKSLKLKCNVGQLPPQITPPPTPCKPKFNPNTEDTKL